MLPTSTYLYGLRENLTFRELYIQPIVNKEKKAKKKSQEGKRRFRVRCPRMENIVTR